MQRKFTRNTTNSTMRALPRYNYGPARRIQSASRIRPRRYVRCSAGSTLSGDIIYDRLINNCYWSPNNAWGIFDDNEQYTLDEVTEMLEEDCANSGEFDSTREAINWGAKCAQAIFENRQPYDYEDADDDEYDEYDEYDE